MSRVGKRPIAIPSGVTVNLSDSEVQVKGPRGELACPIPTGITAKVEEDNLVFDRADDSKPAKTNHGLARALANNVIVGVTDGFVKKLEIEGVGYRADVKGKSLNLLLQL